MLVLPTPGALVWPAAMIVWGPGFTTAGHRHHCVQLVMAMRGTLLIRGISDDPWMRCGAALVRPDATHEVDARDTTVLIGFVDSESELGAALSERIEGGISCLSDTQIARWRADIGRPPTEARVERWVKTELLHRRRSVRIHPGVSLVLKHLREKLGISDDFSLKAMAGISGLSQSRFMHVFTESMGVALRPYVLCLRLQRACCDLIASVTAAAHSAGFSDAAHLTRTFCRMLGMTPTDLALRKRLSRGVTLDRVDSHRERINPTSPLEGCGSDQNRTGVKNDDRACANAKNPPDTKPDKRTWDLSLMKIILIGINLTIKTATSDRAERICQFVYEIGIAKIEPHFRHGDTAHDCTFCALGECSLFLVSGCASIVAVMQPTDLRRGYDWSDSGRLNGVWLGRVFPQ